MGGAVSHIYGLTYLLSLPLSLFLSSLFSFLLSSLLSSFLLSSPPSPHPPHLLPPLLLLSFLHALFTTGPTEDLSGDGKVCHLILYSLGLLTPWDGVCVCVRVWCVLYDECYLQMELLHVCCLSLCLDFSQSASHTASQSLGQPASQPPS